jgi:hypothetical protein
MIIDKIYTKYSVLKSKATSKARLHKAMVSLSEIVKGKDCFVLGSSPTPSLERFNKNMSLVCVNGSSIIADKLNIPPPIMTVVDFELLDVNINRSKPARSAIIKNELLNDLDLGFIVSSQSNTSPGGHPDELKAKYSGFISLYKSDCRKIIHQATGVSNLENDVHGMLSRGMFSIGLCFWLGASSVTFSGFSLTRKNKNESTYFYGDVTNNIKIPDVEYKSLEDWDTRAHSMADCQLLGQLSLNGHKVYSDSKEFIPLLQNWGHVPPDWAKRN